MLLDDMNPVETKKGLKDKLLSNPWSDSFIEIIVTLIVSNIALLLSGLITLLRKPNGTDSLVTIIDFVYSAIKPSDITVYIFAFIAPAIWIMFRRMKYWKNSTLWVCMLVVQIVMIFFLSVIFSLTVTNELNNIDVAGNILTWCFFIALAVWYFSLVYQKKYIDDPASQIKRLSPGGDRTVSLIASLESERDKYE